MQFPFKLKSIRVSLLHRMTIGFIIVGTMKSGTTTLAHCLNNHDDIYIPQKEINFFDRDQNYYKGYAFYHKQFKNGMQKKIIGEKTPVYSYLPQVPKRIFKYKPNIKLIWIFRNPVDRAYSNYWHAIVRGREHLTFEQAIIKN